MSPGGESCGGLEQLPVEYGGEDPLSSAVPGQSRGVFKGERGGMCSPLPLQICGNKYDKKKRKWRKIGENLQNKTISNCVHICSLGGAKLTPIYGPFRVKPLIVFFIMIFRLILSL